MNKCFDNYALYQRYEFRKHLRGLPSGWIPADEWKWKRDPKDWAWLNEAEREFLTLTQLKKEVKKEGVNSQKEYRAEQRNHPDWPASPSVFYEEWVSDYDLFGREKPKFITLPQLREAVKKEGVTAQPAYLKAQKRHLHWPALPNAAYADEWINWPDLFGREKPKFLTLPQLRKAVKKEGVTAQPAYMITQKRHPHWPAGVDAAYGDEWINWPDLFGREKPKFITLPQLKKEVKRAGVTSYTAYQKEKKKHPNWPFRPEATYGDEWVSWRDLHRKPEFLTLPQLKKAVKKNGLNAAKAYKELRKEHPDWPAHPDNIYKSEWISWPDLFGRSKWSRKAPRTSKGLRASSE